MEERTGTGAQKKQHSRTCAHSHITGLGLDKECAAIKTKDGFFGQENAREAAGVIVALTKKQKMAGKAVLLAGPSGTGKTALALGMARELGERIPFCVLAGSEVYSAEVKKTEILVENMRKAIGLKIKTVSTVYEGEVASLVFNGSPKAFTDGGKKITEINVELKCQKGKKSLRLDPSMYGNILSERVRTGDIVTIDATSGSLKRLGRSETFSAEHDIESEIYLPVPKGDVKKVKETVHQITLHDLDSAHACPKDGQDAIALINRLGKTKKTEITEKLRNKVNASVTDLVLKGAAEIIPGVLFIDEVHMLDADCFAFLNRALEMPTAPTFVLATNKKEGVVRGTGIRNTLGISNDLLDRFLIIQTQQYGKEDIKAVLVIRARTENISMEEGALEALVEIAERTSLRHAMHLMAPAEICAKSGGFEKIEAAHIKEAEELFCPVRR
ncbi:MAG: RuvB-like helicase 1 [Amphiamblys sp. WSBS2006]|nr:MAG: RuvB-like helicase 1 [Amphiamblys sp. WSBS2006]